MEYAEKYDFNIVAINDLSDIDAAIHLLKYDSVHGRLNNDVQKISDNEFALDGKKLTYISEKLPQNLPWRELNVDLVMECTGTLKSKKECELHLEAGAKKVLISCPIDDVDNTIVYGINQDSLDYEKDTIVSNASCTTNCLAHVVNAIHKEIGIENGFATTVHSYTSDQRLVDTNHKDPRRSRAAASSMIPTSTGATKAIAHFFPELNGKLSGLSIRVPTPNVSLLDFTFTASRIITENDIRQAIIKYSNTLSKDIFDYTDELLVSSDFNHSPCSAMVDMSLIKIVDGRIGHVVAWYDNEWGFSVRMLDTAQKMLRP
jgi:glyceraldehyde 3-phosphate dehydrogenase